MKIEDWRIEELTGYKPISTFYTDFSIADWGSSGIPNVENFLVQIMEYALIEYVQLSIDLAHGYPPSEYSNFNIAANDFCKILVSLPNHNALPTAQFNIVK